MGELTTAELGRRIDTMHGDNLRAFEDIKTLVTEFRHEMRSDYVQRNEYDIWCESAWREILTVKADLRETRKELDTEKGKSLDRYRTNARWVIATIVSAISCGVAVIALFVR